MSAFTLWHRESKSIVNNGHRSWPHVGIMGILTLGLWDCTTAILLFFAVCCMAELSMGGKMYLAEEGRKGVASLSIPFFVCVTLKLPGSLVCMESFCSA